MDVHLVPQRNSEQVFQKLLGNTMGKFQTLYFFWVKFWADVWCNCSCKSARKISNQFLTYSVNSSGVIKEPWLTDRWRPHWKYSIIISFPWYSCAQTWKITDESWISRESRLTVRDNIYCLWMSNIKNRSDWKNILEKVLIFHPWAIHALVEKKGNSCKRMHYSCRNRKRSCKNRFILTSFFRDFNVCFKILSRIASSSQCFFLSHKTYQILF